MRRHSRPGLQWILTLGLLAFLLVIHSAEGLAENRSTDEADDSRGASRTNVITSIEFQGNAVTQDKILRQELLIQVGDKADPARIEQSRQAIMNLGLFVWVRVQLLPVEGGVGIIFTVKEKYYVLPVPKLNRDEKDQFTLGAELTVDNLAGYNQQLKLRYETEESDAEAGGEIVTYLFSYNYPRIFGSRWQLQMEATQTTGPVDRRAHWDDENPTWLYNKQARTAGFQLKRWIAKTGPSQGWQGGSGLIWRRNTFEYLSTYGDVLANCEPAVPGVACPVRDIQDSVAVGIEADISFKQVSDYLYSRQGTEYGYSGEYGSKTLGSDNRYTRHEFYWRHYYLLDGRPHENIDMQARLGLSSSDMFLGDNYAYSLGGNRTLRAYENSAAEGNSYLIVNAQYLAPLFGYYPLRGVVFLDAGNTFPSNQRIHLGKILWDVGVGLRFRLKSFVKIDLRADVSYSPDSGETRVFLGTKEMF